MWPPVAHHFGAVTKLSQLHLAPRAGGHLLQSTATQPDTLHISNVCKSTPHDVHAK